MGEDVTFVVEHEEGDNSGVFLIIGLTLIAIAAIGGAMYLRSTAIRRRKERQEASAMEPMMASPFTPMDFSSAEDMGFGFIPEAEAFPSDDMGFGFIPEVETAGLAEMGGGISFTPDIGMDEEADLGISFIPDAHVLLEEPEIAFVPDIAPVSFGIFEDEPEPVHAPKDKVRCPKCKRTFETDRSSEVICPHCGFSAGVRTW